MFGYLPLANCQIAPLLLTPPCMRPSTCASNCPPPLQLKKVEPYAVHCTFQYSANTGKRNRMREAMLFEDEPEYYTGEGAELISLQIHAYGPTLDDMSQTKMLHRLALWPCGPVALWPCGPRIN